MKKVILTVGMFIAMAGASYAQAPEEFNYQAVARDVAGNVLPNQTVGVEISILESSSSGTVIYTETHAPSTNNFGLLNLNIGRGTVVSGTFNTIDWANDNYFVQISMDMTGGNTYNLMGTSQLISVPYALHAKTANSVANDMVDDADADPTNEFQNLSVSNDTIYISNGNHAILPSAVDTDEQTLTLSNDSLFISSGNGVSLSTYAVDMVDDADNDPTNEIETWNTLSGIPAGIADGVDNVDDADADATNEIQDISLTGTNLSITSGATVDLSPLQDGVNDADADATNEIQDISLTGTNLSITSGSTVDLSPLQDGVNDADADATNEIQDISLTGTNLSITSGSTIDLSPLQDGVNDADADATNEIQSLSLSGSSLSISGGNSVTLPSGGSSLWTEVTANVKYSITQFPTDADITYGNTDVSGMDFQSGNGIFWGSHANEATGMFTDGDQIRFISPGDGSTPAGTSTIVEFWEEDGNALQAYIAPNGQYFQVSDKNLKENIKSLDKGLDKVLKLNGYIYDYKQCEEDIKKNTPVNTTIGIMAQDLIKVAPELVTKTGQGHFIVNYDGIIPILIEATKEQQGLISNQQAEIDALKAELEEIKELLKK